MLRTMRSEALHHLLVVVGLFAAGCETGGSSADLGANEPSGSHELAGSNAPAPAPAPAVPPPSAPPAPPPREPVHVFDGGLPARVVEHADAEREGLTVIDLSNQWAPYLFSDCTPGLQDCQANAYRPTYVALANEQQPPAGASNPEGRYLELFGVAPSLSVIRRRILDDEAKPCVARLTYDALREFEGFLSYQSGGEGQARQQAQATRVAAARTAKKLGLSGPEALRDVPGEADQYGRLHKADVRFRSLIEAQDRIQCEGLVPRAGTMRRGSFDWPTHQGLVKFERKNRIFGWGFIGRDTIDDLRRTPAEGHYHTFIRALEERIVDAAGVIEDGSVRQMSDAPSSFRTVDGSEEPLRNVVEEYRDVVLRALGLGSAVELATWLKGLTDEQLETLKVAVRLPPRPSYYAPHMELSVDIDRGDVWYDFPWDESGTSIPQPVSRRPRLTLYVTYDGQRIPLAYYGTTIGGWRSELIEGEEYYAYKSSDVGPRIWRQIFAAPAWVPPDSTPLGGLVTKGRSGARRRINFDEFGPGYASAYGLVAAYNLEEIPREDGSVGYFDNGIRVHGSVDYMSIMQRHSHGCHRLYNHLALRLFTFVLRHRAHRRIGQTQIQHRRDFEYEGDSYTFSLSTRGYLFELEPQLPVEVLEGRIMGVVTSPPELPMRKPGVVYRADVAQIPEVPSTGANPVPPPR